MLVDSHCHLNYPELADLDAILAQAEENGVGVMQTISCKRSDFDEVIALCERDQRIYGSIGIHPHEAEHHTDITVQELLERADHPKIIGIGESGLDYYYEHSPRELQQKSFRIHIEAARESGLPLIVHTRDAEGDTMDILEEEYAKGPFKGLIHCFSSSSQLAERSMKIGLFISISGIITFKKADELRETTASIPLESLLVETDSPYLAPLPHRGKPNQPAYTRHTAEMLAQVKQVENEEVERVTTDNFFRLFDKASREAIIS